MHLRLLPVVRWPKGQWLPLAALVLWAGLVVFVVQVNRTAQEPIGLCPFKRVTGVPCPTCGGTRAVLHASEGEVGAAFLSNPLLFTALIVLTVAVGLRLVAGRRVALGLSDRQRKALWPTLGGLLLLNWVYVILFVG